MEDGLYVLGAAPVRSGFAARMAKFVRAAMRAGIMPAPTRTRLQDRAR